MGLQMLNYPLSTIQIKMFSVIFRSFDIIFKIFSRK